MSALAYGVLFAAVAVLAGCGGGGADAGPQGAAPPVADSTLPPAVAAAAKAHAAVPQNIVSADNAFGLNLLSTLARQPQHAAANIAISPTSLALSLQVLYNGAGGTTQQAMSQVLQLGSLSMQQINEANAALQASLLDPDPQTTLIIANSLWMHSGNAVLPAFIQTDQTYYGATLGDLAGAPDNVNAWVRSRTNGLITSILPPANYSVVIAVIANAVYFKGQWTQPFDASQTASRSFTTSDGSQKSVATMYQAAAYPYLQGAGFQAIRLPYGQGRLSMLIVLPDSGTPLESFLASVTADSVEQWTSQMKSSDLRLSMPKFTTVFNSELTAALSSLGMAIAFSCTPPEAADFSALSPGVCVQNVEHDAVVQVDETGTTAAAATTITVGISAVSGLSLTVDHPFLYAIRDDQSGALLFVGIVQDPTQQ
jgi:serpin B